MNLPLLDIQPRTLKFVVDLKKQSSCLVQLTNTTHHFVAFKVKTTSPKKYCVRPNVGVVSPNSSCEFTVIMQVLKEPPPDMVCKDKFLIQNTVVPAETTDEDITASMFSKVEGKHVEEYKLRVTLVSMSDSPELSPIKGALKQDSAFENSILKDQSETLAPPQNETEPRMVEHDAFKTANDAKELNPPKRGFVEEFDPAKGGYDESRMAKETEYDPVRSHKNTDDQIGIKPTYNLDAPMKKAMNLPGDQGFKLVKDIEEMKRKLSALESKLKQADSTISKLMEERSISSQHRQSLQQELEELRTKKIVKKVYIGFPLLFVCVVAFISIVIGYFLRT